MGNCVRSASVIHPSKTGPLDIQLSCSLWPHDSAGLYSTVNKTHSSAKMRLTQPGTIFRQGSQVRWAREQTPHQGVTLLRVKEKGGEPVLVPVSQGDPDQPVHKRITDSSTWVVVKNKGRYSTIEEGGVLKMGKIVFLVRKVQTETKAASVASLDVSREELNIPEVTSVLSCGSVEEESVCRFCMTRESESDPLLTACDCAGSMKHIHLGCLRKWNQDKVSSRVTSTSSLLLWRVLKCEICNFQYRDTVRHQEQEFELVDRPASPPEPHLLLEMLGSESSPLKGWLQIRMPTKKSLVSGVKIGRGLDSGLRLTDLSISRQHALVKLVNGAFHIRDLDSKYGTFSLLTTPLSLFDADPRLELAVSHTRVQVAGLRRQACRVKTSENLSMLTESPECVPKSERELADSS